MIGAQRLASFGFAVARGAKPSAPLADQAEAVIKYLEKAGDLAKAKPASIEVDRRIIETMAATYHRDREINDSDIGRKFKLSHTSVRDRRIARSARIMAQLHKDCPSLWNAKARPVNDGIDKRTIAQPPLALAA
jgi:hypothetical protein